MDYKKRISVRLDERTAMLLNELSNLTNNQHINNHPGDGTS